MLWLAQSCNPQTVSYGVRKKGQISPLLQLWVTKKHMEVLMEMPEHQMGSVLTSPKADSFVFPSPSTVSVGRREVLGQGRMCAGYPSIQQLWSSWDVVLSLCTLE